MSSHAVSALGMGRRNPLLFILLIILVTLSLVKLRRGSPGPHEVSDSDDGANGQWSYSLSHLTNSDWGEQEHAGSGSSEWDTPESFIPWMRSRGITPEQVPFVTLGDRNYSRAHQNLHQRLQQWGYGKNTVVLCLDKDCALDLPYGFGGFVGQSVAALKFAANLDLARNGYSFVFLDGDVYLTGSHDPFAKMLPLSDNSWDIQFQPDEGEPHPGLNIGWYFARSNVATIRYFERSSAIWEESGRTIWDQEVMDKLGQQMEFEDPPLKIYRLYGKRFPNFMLRDWEASLFGNEPVVQQFIADAAMIHYTCVQQNLKTFFGLNFGGFGDLKGYYSHPPPLLAVANISGQSDSIHGQIAFAAQIANRTGRTLIWPDSVDMIQRVRHEATADSGGWTDYLHNPNFPGIRVASYGEAEEAGLRVVEGRYLHNHARNNHGRTLKQVSIDVAAYVLDPQRGILGLEKYIGKVKSTQVVVLDFASFSPQFLREADRNLRNLVVLKGIAAKIDKVQGEWYRDVFTRSGAEEYIGRMFGVVRKCGGADWDKECLNICNGEGMG